LHCRAFGRKSAPALAKFALKGALDPQAALIDISIGAEGGQPAGSEKRIWRKTRGPRLVQMQIHEFGAYIETPERRPD